METRSVEDIQSEYCYRYVVRLNEENKHLKVKQKLQAVQELLRNDRSQSANMKFLKYAQSSRCRNMNDSSVSYASAALVFE